MGVWGEKRVAGRHQGGFEHVQELDNVGVIDLHHDGSLSQGSNSVDDPFTLAEYVSNLLHYQLLVGDAVLCPADNP